MSDPKHKLGTQSELRDLFPESDPGVALNLVLCLIALVPLAVMVAWIWTLL